MTLPIYQVDAFAQAPFTGNPAAVCPLDAWLPDEKMQAIAMENNLAETAFFVKEGDRYHIRWFTPTVEVPLCGHATLASAFVLFEVLGHSGEKIDFFSQHSGNLSVTRENGLLVLDFPAEELTELQMTESLYHGISQQPVSVLRGKNYLLLVYEQEEDILQLMPDFPAIATIDALAVVVTAPGRSSDFVSRFFGPNVGVNEDPVTGSAHTLLIPYWAQRLGKNDLTGIQLSARRGHLTCALAGNRVKIGGKAVLYMEGRIFV